MTGMNRSWRAPTITRLIDLARIVDKSCAIGQQVNLVGITNYACTHVCIEKRSSLQHIMKAKVQTVENILR